MKEYVAAVVPQRIDGKIIEVDFDVFDRRSNHVYQGRASTVAEAYDRIEQLYAADIVML